MSHRFALQIKDYRLCTLRVLYYLPDYSNVLQQFTWQLYDIAPDYPGVRHFVDYWQAEIDARIHSVSITREELVRPPRYNHGAGLWQLH